MICCRNNNTDNRVNRKHLINHLFGFFCADCQSRAGVAQRDRNLLLLGSAGLAECEAGEWAIKLHDLVVGATHFQSMDHIKRRAVDDQRVTVVAATFVRVQLQRNASAGLFASSRFGTA